MIRVGILGLARREGTFAEVGLRSWEEAGCSTVQDALLASAPGLYYIHRPLVLRSQPAELARTLRDWCDTPQTEHRCDLILTVGGTGFSPDDSLPEATRPLLDRDAPGLADLLRRTCGDAGFPQAALSRGLAGMRRRILIINLPGDAMGFADHDLLALAMGTLTPHLPRLLAALAEDIAPPWTGARRPPPKPFPPRSGPPKSSD